jgi:hypothetical protein
LFAIKDEFVHADVCAPAQHVHAGLFIVHPLVFAALAPTLASISRARRSDRVARTGSRQGIGFADPAAILTLYMIYHQAVYWNFIWKAPATEFEARQ